MNKQAITISLIIIGAALLLKLCAAGIKNIKPDEFHPAAIMFVVDSSASNQKQLPEQKKVIKQICAQLDPEDKVKIIKVSQDAYLIYEGSAQNTSGMTKSMESFTKLEPNKYGTAYGDGIKKAFSYVLTTKKDGYIPGIVVIGDLENEGAVEKQINWNTLPKNISNVKKYAPDVAMMFLFAHPQKLDMVKEKLSPVLGEDKLILAPEETADKSIRNFFTAIGR